MKTVMKVKHKMGIITQISTSSIVLNSFGSKLETKLFENDLEFNKNKIDQSTWQID